MGPEVQGVPEAAGLADGGDTFGRWFRNERELRGLSVYFVAARTRLAPERVIEIERGDVRLGSGPYGRQTARQMADAIGADAKEAVAQLGEARSPWLGDGRSKGEARSRAGVPWQTLAFRAASVALVLGVVGAAAWGIYSWWDARGSGEGAPVVYRTDYVDELIGED